MMPKMGKKTPSSRADKGKQVVEYQKKPSTTQAAEPTKMLASSSAAFQKAASRVSIPLDTTLEEMQSFELMEQGLVELQQVQPIQAVPPQAQAAPVAIVEAAVVVQVAPIQAAQEKASKPAAKLVTKRPAPTTEEADPVAKRQKVKEDLAIKVSRMELEKKKKEDRLQKAERMNEKRRVRTETIKAQINKLVEENILVQHSLILSGYIPFTPEESEMCYLEAIIQACKKSLITVKRLKGYSKEDHDFMRKLVSSRRPLFNNELSERFNIIVKDLVERPLDQIEKRRAKHPDARFVEDIIEEKLKERWTVCWEKFIKAYYLW